MTDVPEDIREAALSVVDRGYDVGLIAAVTTALLAERERCAKIAEDVGRAYCRDHFVMMGPAGIAHKVAFAIRKQS